jgi:maltooligosyltrehalose trehalohydrolase
MSMHIGEHPRLGANYRMDDRCDFCVWAPAVKKIEVLTVAPERACYPLVKDSKGYHRGATARLGPGCQYFYRLEGAAIRPDPASRFQPLSVHGPSAVVDPSFDWQDRAWRGLALREFVIYELHVGTYTDAGSFDAITVHLERLKRLGVTALELMPVGQFPGTRNWGYDGVFPFAVQNSYGGPTALKRLVNACHRAGLAVILDVVYNHLGPEGNYFGDFGPYFTDRYRTPWGPALNFDGPASDEVREFFLQNACYWLAEFHFDALRLDAVHAILDHSARPFLDELAAQVAELALELNRPLYLMPESSANDARLIRAAACGGCGLDAVWSDDFHHALRTLLTGEQDGYYQDFGELGHLVKAYRDGFAYAGEYSRFRGRRHGSSAKALPAERFIVFAQNHDQVGNRADGARLSASVSFAALKLAAATVILSPYVPLLFMGEEYGETAPFPYFISHADPALIEAVRLGRRAEFAAFAWQDELPDPQDEATFQRAKLTHQVRQRDHHGALYAFYKELLRLRREHSALAELNKDTMHVIGYERQRVLRVHRWSGTEQIVILANFAAAESPITVSIPPGQWQKLLDSEDKKWQGVGSRLPRQFQSAGAVSIVLAPHSAALFKQAGVALNER